MRQASVIASEAKQSNDMDCRVAALLTIRRNYGTAPRLGVANLLPQVGAGLGAVNGVELRIDLAGLARLAELDRRLAEIVRLSAARSPPGLPR